MTTQPAVRIRGLRKSFGDQHVLQGVDLDVPRGSIFALLGSNGAGKTTVVRILATLLRADAGTAGVDGFDVADFLQAGFSLEHYELLVMSVLGANSNVIPFQKAGRA